MLRVQTVEQHSGRLRRRDLLSFAGQGALAGAFGGLAAAAETTNAALLPGFGRAKSVIVVFTSGGQSQHETWDPKPEAPAQIRGEFRPIDSRVPGLLLGEHMPRIAQVADRFTVVRSMSHEDLDHGSAVYLMFTGQYHARRSSNPQATPLDLPCYSSVYHRLRPRAPFVYPAMHVNGPALTPRFAGAGQFAGLLGRDFEPFVVGDVTTRHEVIPALAPQADLPSVRLHRRQTLLSSIEHARRHFERNRAIGDMQTLYRQAFEMLDRPATRHAFDLSREPDSLRDRYGRNRSGQACLLARRLVEAGVPLVTVVWNHSNRGQDIDPTATDLYGWDTHNDIFPALRDHLLPRFDLSFSALIEDLDARGLLDETLVLCLGEFGRAPLVKKEPGFAGESAGRKHWAGVYSMVAAGAGVHRGSILGESDSRGAYPRSAKYGPWDATATLFSALGIHPAGHFKDPAGRPYPISTGRVISGLYPQG